MVTRSRMLAAAAIAATVVLGAQTWHKAFRAGGNDLTSYLLSARALWDGQSPYGLETPFPYIYPLFLAFILIPLAALPYGAAVVAWFAASAAALGAILVKSAFGRIDRGRQLGYHSDFAIAATVLVTFNIIQNNLLNGQVNFLVVLCCLLAVAAAGRPSAFAQCATADKEGGHYVGGTARQRREMAAGAWLGAGIALKLMPALLVVYLLVRRQFRAIAVAVVTAIVFALAPALLIGAPAAGFVESGFSRIAGVYSQYVRELLMPMMTTPEGDTVLAYSIASVVQRASGASPALWIEILCAAAVLGTIAVLDVSVWRRRGDDLAAAAAYLAAIVLISPKSETHHLAFAIPAVAMCFSRVFEEGRRPARLPALAFLVSAVALLAAPFTGPAEGPAITAAAVLLLAALSALPRAASRI